MNKNRFIKCLLLFATILFSYNAEANFLLQHSKVSVNLENTTLKEVFESIEQQTELVFVYNNNDVDNKRIVSVKANVEPVENLLDEILAGTNITYTVDDKYILLKSANEAKNDVALPAALPQDANKISGKIVNSEGQPIDGVTIIVKGTSVGGFSVSDGSFIINAKKDDILELSLLGYKTREITIQTQSFLNITLEDDIESLEETVVVGFTRVKKVSLTGAVSSIKMDDVIGTRPVASTGNLLQGVIPGLQVTSTSGEPGQGVSMNIRGETSINGGSPLILVDNVPLNGPLSLINPDDIANVSVLKDGGAAAIYGARGAFGVILITTKGGGKLGEKTRVSYTGNVAFSSPTSLPEKASPLSTVQAFKDAGYLEHRGRIVNDWIELLGEYNRNPSQYPEGYAMKNDIKYLLSSQDQIKDFLSETGFQQVHNASISGGTDRSSYRVSLGYTGSDGIMVTSNDSYNKLSVRGFISSKITNWLTGELDMNYYKSMKEMPNTADYSLAVALPSYTPLGTVNVDGEDLLIGTPANLARLGGINQNGYRDTRITGRLVAKPIKDLSITGELTWDDLNTTTRNYSKRFIYAAAYDFDRSISRSESSLINTKQATDYTTLNLFASYNKSFGDHNFALLAGYNVEIYHMDNLMVTRAGMINDEMPSLELATGTPTVGEGVSEYSLMGVFGSFSYDYKSKYFFDFKGRYDGSSKFPKNHRWGFFPSFSAAWRVTQEPFMEWIKNVVPEFKIRASYATLGNQAISSYEFIPSMSDYRPSWLHENEQVVSLNAPLLVSDNFTWETIETYNLGIDMAMFKNKLNLTFELYRRETKDMLSIYRDFPSVVGAIAPKQNVANMRSDGFEIDIKWRDKIGDVRYHVGLNFYDYKSKITKFRGNDTKLLFNNDGSNRHYEGYEIGTIWGYTSQRFYNDSDYEGGSLKADIAVPSGVIPNPGDMLFVDYDKSGIIDDKNKSTSDNPNDIQNIGNSSLRYQYGINGGVGWKNFDLSFYIHGIGKRDVYMSNEIIFPMYYEWGGLFSHQNNYWTPDNTNAYYSRLYMQGSRDKNTSSNIRSQTKYLLNGAYLRVKNITLSYSLPQSIISKWGINTLKVFSSIENPFMFHDLPKGVDPTLSNKGRGLGYPVMRIVSFGINLEL